MTTRAEISAWFDAGVAKGAKYMLVICDTFDHGDYASYAATDKECVSKYDEPGEMQRVMEVYNLAEPKEPQMNERRCFRLPPRPVAAPHPAPAAPSEGKALTDAEIATECGGWLEAWMTTIPKPAMWHFKPEGFAAFTARIRADERAKFERHGWKLVPPEATPEMMKAWEAARPANAAQDEEGAWNAPSLDWQRAKYAAMLAAAPASLESGLVGVTMEPLSAEELTRIAIETQSADPGTEGYILPHRFARAIEKAHGIAARAVPGEPT